MSGTGYVVNNGNYTNRDLVSIFPAYEAFRIPISTSLTSVSDSVTLTKNSTSSTTYTVLATYENGTNGSAWTNDQASSNLNNIVIRPKTASSFTYNFTKAAGLYDGFLNFLVIY